MTYTPEILSPAGNFEKMKAAILYGADAVYLAGNRFGMRAAADNYSIEEIYEDVKYAHERGVKVYVTVNTMPKVGEYEALEEYLSSLRGSGIDAVIVADLGVIDLVKRVLPEVELHISTQTSIVSPQTCMAYYRMGAKRVVLARELSLKEIIEIRKNIPDDLELEVFIHGSMCVSWSGRCLLSEHLTGRDANCGACTQPCRWSYKLYEIIEDKRPDAPLPIEQTEHGTFIMSSKDMCMIEHIPELLSAGIKSFKIEGRMKSAYYTAVTTNAYRMAFDRYMADPGNYVYDPAWKNELESVSHREYNTGYFFGNPILDANVCEFNGYLREKAYIAQALSYEDGVATFIQRNKVCVDDKVEVISPGKCGVAFDIEWMTDENGGTIESAPHPGMIFKINAPFEILPGDIIRLG
ncbi:MAG: U32 family peptidase [Clostridia bacterium]|nr:U32 family peptidase [Clostridia bacterium]